MNAQAAAGAARDDRDTSGSAGLKAGGTVARDPQITNPDFIRCFQLACEIVLFFVIAPIAMHCAIHKWGMPLFLVLQPVLIAFILFLVWDPTFKVTRELTRGFSLGDLFSILVIFIGVGGAVTVFVAQAMPGQFLSFPRNRPETWSRIMVLYPLLSVAAQELFYRTFFFHRYGPLFGRWKWLAIFTNGALFGFGHILFGNWIAVAGTTFSGTLFAYRYATTRSFWAVFIEHTLWGWLVFTAGLGMFFFTGISNHVVWR